VAKIAILNPSVYQKDIAKLVDTFFETIVKAIQKNDRFELRGFGTFGVKQREARIARNPKTGSVVAVSKKNTPFFRMGKGMRVRINK
jgi:integration host factor subunit beta